MKIGTVAPLHAVHRPPHLRQALQLAEGADLRMGIHRKAAVIGGVPVLAGHDRLATRQTGSDRLIGNRDDGVARRDRQRAAGAKIVLQIDQQQGRFHRRSKDQ